MTDSTVLGEEIQYAVHMIQYAVHMSKQIAFPKHLAQKVDTATLVT